MMLMLKLENAYVYNRVMLHILQYIHIHVDVMSVLIAMKVEGVRVDSVVEQHVPSVKWMHIRIYSIYIRQTEIELPSLAVW